MTIIPLSEGSFTVDKTKQFVPFDNEQDELQARSKGSLLVEIQPFIVKTSRDILLLDTGLGFHDRQQNEMQLHASLKKAGIRPEEVTKVLMTHLHKDHAGGVSLDTDHSQLTLPNATYYVQKRELDFAMETGFPSFITEELEPLTSSSQVQFLHDDEGVIDGYISYKLTSGHSPFHQAFWIREDDETILFGGDEAPQLHQMKVRYKTKYDANPERALHWRQLWWKEGKEKGWTFLFYHDIKHPTHRPQHSPDHTPTP